MPSVATKAVEENKLPCLLRTPELIAAQAKPKHQPRRQGGFTLLEVVAVTLLIAILAALTIPNFSRVIAAAQQVVCASNMRSIRVALGAYLEDHGKIWPQGAPLPQEPGWSVFWINTLKPYDIRERTWQCPTIRGMTKGQDDDAFGLHYVPTQFDSTPNIANRWTTQPWLIEVADAHGQGPLICFPDGSVKPFLKVLAEQGLR
jgi:prepilin-type N-terminal cleavage/methylation domain-containing protein